jgi:Na+/H+ antiporter NhaD/arsenite permease-like protein
MTTQQWIALGIFVLSYGLIISEKVSRTIASIFGAVLAFLFILMPQDLLHYENWETILFVFGMMIVIETMSESGFFLWLGLHNAKWVKLDPLKLFILFPFIAGFLSAFVDSITVMLFMATLTIEVGHIIGINPLPLIFAEICAANTGGASTMVGDPPNVVAVATYERMTDKKISWGYYCKACYPAMMVVVAVFNLLLYLFYIFDGLVKSRKFPPP